MYTQSVYRSVSLNFTISTKITNAKKEKQEITEVNKKAYGHTKLLVKYKNLIKDAGF